MPEARINFFTEDIEFKIPFPRKTSTWVKACILHEKKNLKELNFIFCSDEHLLQINQEYLKHRSYTDIITFDNSEVQNSIEGDIFISVDRLKENSKKLNVKFQDELHRVMIHGVLHLMGYSDKGGKAKLAMRKKEDDYLSLRKWE